MIDIIDKVLSFRLGQIKTGDEMDVVGLVNTVKTICTGRNS